jgi:hypothetical protein
LFDFGDSGRNPRAQQGGKKLSKISKKRAKATFAQLRCVNLESSEFPARKTPMSDDPNHPHLTPVTQNGSRHARKQLHCDVLMVHGAESWSSHLEDISATGVRVARPSQWKGCPDDLYSIDLMFHDDLHIHLNATLARITRSHLGFAYTRIPEDKEQPLWNLLGGYADRLEEFKD